MSCENPLDEVTDRRILACNLTCQQGENLGIRETNEPLKGQSFGRWRVAVAGFQIADQQVIDLPHASAAAPAKAVQFGKFHLTRRRDNGHQTARLTMISLILPMALVGLRLFGQTSTQFMMV